MQARAKRERGSAKPQATGRSHQTVVGGLDARLMNKRVAVLTSGGDAPGMNAAVRAIVRTGIHHGCEMFGVQRGFEGLIGGNILHLSARDVGGVMQTAGTFLGTAR